MDSMDCLIAAKEILRNYEKVLDDKIDACLLGMVTNLCFSNAFSAILSTRSGLPMPDL